MFEETDDNLLRRLRNHDHTAFADIYSKYFNRLTVEAWYVVNSWDTAKDIVQDTFARWLDNRTLHNLSQRKDVKLLLYMKQAVRMNSVSACTKASAQEQFNKKYHLQLHDKIEVGYDTTENAAEVEFRIQQFVAKLPPMRKKMILEVYMEENNVKEVARRNGIAIKTVRNHLHRGLEFIRKSLSPTVT
jgi:RNA polymerase sigma-70 factor (ECF subfamily)